MATFAGLYTEEIFDQTGGPARDTLVEVRPSGSMSLATLYTDRTKSSVAPNPARTDALGNLTVYADPGVYDFTANNGTFRDSVEVDPADADATGLFEGKADVSYVDAELAERVGRGELVFDVRDYGADPTGVVDATVAIQAALDAAAAAGGRVFARGTFRTSGTLAVKCNLGMGDAQVMYYGTGTAVRVGGDSGVQMRDLRGHLPKVRLANAPTTGWVAGSVGVEFTNIFAGSFDVPVVSLFEVGVLLYGRGGATPNIGVAYNTFTLGTISTNKVNVAFGADPNGFSNQNNFIGGRLMHDVARGARVAGTRHVLIPAATNSPINIHDANVFLGTSLESPNVVEYHIECAGQDNYWKYCRFENTGPNNEARVWWRAGAQGNVIDRGVSAMHVTETYEAGAKASTIASRGRHRIVGGDTVVPTLLLENTTVSTGAAALNAPTRRVLEPGGTVAGVDQAAAWAVEESAGRTRFKRPTDVAPRVVIDHQTQRIYFGTGAADPTMWVGAANSTSLAVGGGPLLFDVDNSYDIGTTGAGRPRHIRAGTAVIAGVFTTAARPAATAVPVGSMIYDSTLGKPVWTNGTAWRDAAGTAV